MLSVDEPEPGAAIDVGLNVAEAPEGTPETESETDELTPPLTLVETVALPLLPEAIVSADGETESVKSGEVLGLNTMLSTEWISMPFGATPVWPWRKSNMPTPVICTGTLAVWKLVVALNIASKVDRAEETPLANGLLAETQLGAGISAIMVSPEASLRTRW